jgi:hypothetical protein
MFCGLLKACSPLARAKKIDEIAADAIIDLKQVGSAPKRAGETPPPFRRVIVYYHRAD